MLAPVYNYVIHMCYYFIMIQIFSHYSNLIQSTTHINIMLNLSQHHFLQVLRLHTVLLNTFIELKIHF